MDYSSMIAKRIFDKLAVLTILAVILLPGNIKKNNLSLA